MDATPLRPAKETRDICAREAQKGARIQKTAAGRPIKVRKTMMERAGINTSGSCEGVTRSPRRKKIAIWQISVRTSKKWTIDRFSGR